MRALILCVCLSFLVAAEPPSTTPVDPSNDPSAIARAYLATGDIAVLNRLYRTPRLLRRPAVDLVLSHVVTTTDHTTLERAFILLRSLDARGPETITALLPFLAPDQPLQGAALCAIDSLGNDGEALIPVLIDLLPSGNYFTAYALSRIGRHGEIVVPALLAHLHGPDGIPRSGVIQALGNAAWALQADRIIPALAAIIAAPEPIRPTPPFSTGTESLRGSAANALAAFGWQAEMALPALLTALQDDDREARRGVLEALRACGPSAAAAVPRLIALLRSLASKTDPAQRLSAENRLDVTNASYLLDTLRAIGPDARAATTTVVDIVLAQDAILSRKASTALERIGGVSPADVERLLAAADQNPTQSNQYLTAVCGPHSARLDTLLVRWVNANDQLRDAYPRHIQHCQTAPEPTPELLALLQHPERTIRMVALRALGRCHPRPAWIGERLELALTSADADDLTVATNALAADPQHCATVLPKLIDLSATADPVAACRAIAVAAPLDVDHVAMLRALLDDASPGRHLSAAQALADHLTEQEQIAAQTCALTVITNDDRRWFTSAFDLLRKLPANPTTAAPLRAYFDLSDEMMQWQLLPILVWELPNRDAIELLSALLASPSQSLRSRACLLLAQQGPDGSRAVPPLRDLAWAPEGPQVPEARCAIAALDPEDTETVGHVIAQAWNFAAHRDSRLTAIRALTAHPTTRPILNQLGERLGNDPDPEIAAAGKTLAERHR